MQTGPRQHLGERGREGGGVDGWSFFFHIRNVGDTYLETLLLLTYLCLQVSQLHIGSFYGGREKGGKVGELQMFSHWALFAVKCI